ncbi:putative phospholipase A(2) [Lupinus albus]|uniref:Patatin n=1 Tax=Lupinus albus TaxID=3870 RepID=A0A6A4QCA3_LUPAL|nr:putative phospholipase A(2) [Lupinus albus]
MDCDNLIEMQEPSIETDKLSYEIFSLLETNYLFGYDHQNLWLPSPIHHKPPQPPPLLDAVSAVRNQRGKICILAIDSAGMKAILPGKALSYLENALKKKSGDDNATIADYFDVAAGSGVGGIFTAMLFATKDHRRPIFSAEDTWRLLADQGNMFYRQSSGSRSGDLFKRLFSRNGGLSSATTSLEKIVKEAFTDNNGRSLTLKDTLKPVLIPCYDLSTTAPFLFSRADALETDSFDFRLWEVCRATSAEPGLFEPVLMRSVDGESKCIAVNGGLAMSNPTGAAITHVLHNKEEFPFVRGVEDLLVLSLGTGQLLEVKYDYDQVRSWRPKDWARPMTQISGDGLADVIDQAVAMTFGHCRSSNYVRIQANGSTMLIGIAEEMLKQENVESVLFGGKRISEQRNFEKLDWFAGELVQEHQRRSCRIAPTVAFKQATPKRT